METPKQKQDDIIGSGLFGIVKREISSKIQKSFALKAESKRLLEQAKLMVEQEIEKGGE